MSDKISGWFKNRKSRFLITGVAGFVGTNLALRLLSLGQSVTGVDNFITGRLENIEYIRSHGDPNLFEFIEGDLNDFNLCKTITGGVDYVIHEAAIASVPWSLREPELFHSNNDSVFFNILNASRLSGIKRFIYASSSAVYGTNADSPHIEENVGEPLSVYAAAKLSNEIYASSFFHSFGMESIGFRYFNVYGPHQDPGSAYAAVIPLWIKNILGGEQSVINGDGTTTRDFCFIDDIIDLNLLAVIYEGKKKCAVYNGGFGRPVSLNELKEMLKSIFGKTPDFINGPFRDGDVRHSLSDISSASRELGFYPKVAIEEGLKATVEYYRKML